MSRILINIIANIKNVIVFCGKVIINELPFILLFSLCVLPATIGTNILTLLRCEEFGGYKYYLLTFMYTQIVAYIVYKIKFLKPIFYAIGIILLSFFAIVYLLFKSCISPLIFQFILETNCREATEFLATYAFTYKAIIAYLIIIVMVVAIIFIEHSWKYSLTLKRCLNSCKLKLFIGIISIISCIFGIYQTHIFNDMRKCDVGELDHWSFGISAKSMDAISATIYSEYMISVVSKEITQAVKSNKLFYNTTVKAIDNRDIYVIYILGESYIKSHASLYGYQRNTTPFMDGEEKKGNLIAFTDMVAPFNSTTLVQKNSFCCNSLTNKEIWYNSPFFPMLFKKAGYKVTFWDNQRHMDMGGFYTYSANSFFYNKTIMNYSYDATTNKIFDYDGELIDNFLHTEALKPIRHNLIMFHLLGQHFSFDSRYPHTAEYTRFSEKDCPNKAPYLTDSKRKEIADYDNATYYNDCVIKKIASFYADKPAVMVYLSDHGEEVYDYRDSEGRVNPETGMEVKALKYQYEIPLVVWFSNSFIKRYPNIVTATRKAKDKPYMSDNICQLIFHVSGLKTIYHKPERCPLCEQYRPKHRIIADGKDYDKIVKHRK